VGWAIEDSWFDSQQGWEIFPLFAKIRNIWTGYEVSPESNSVTVGALFPKSKAVGE